VGKHIPQVQQIKRMVYSVADPGFDLRGGGVDFVKGGGEA